MKQTLHIFLKDARHFWGEIFLSLAITAAFVAVDPYLWANQTDSRSQMLKVLAGFLLVLMPASWWILMSRCVLAERLVGDTQFWITRPYQWGSLFLAKTLFLAVFLFLPFFIAQCLLLLRAGFGPQNYLPGLLFDLTMIAGIIVLPLAAVSTITSSFARMTLTLLGIFLAFITLLAVSSFIAIAHIGSAHVNPLGDHLTNRLCFLLAVAACAAAIILQYALRKVWIARCILIALPFLFIGAASLASRYNQGGFDRVYPMTHDGTPVQLAYLATSRSTETSGFQMSQNATIPIKVPMMESGVADGFVVIPDAIRAEITAPDGSHWSSDWEMVGFYKFLPGKIFFRPGFTMPLAVYNKYRSVPLNVHLAIAISQAQADKVTTIAMPASAFVVPDFGNCSPETGWAPEFGHVIGINCVSPLAKPQLTYVSTRWSNSACPATQAAADPGVLGDAWVGSLNPETAEFGISPVVSDPVNLSNVQVNESEGRARFRYLCPGTPIVFTQYKAVRQLQMTVDVTDFHLPTVTIAGNQVTVTQ
jgi:hypothetical protein